MPTSIEDISASDVFLSDSTRQRYKSPSTQFPLYTKSCWNDNVHDGQISIAVTSSKHSFSSNVDKHHLHEVVDRKALTNHSRLLVVVDPNVGAVSMGCLTRAIRCRNVHKIVCLSLLTLLCCISHKFYNKTIRNVEQLV